MNRFVLALAAFFILAPVAAQAASFDCAKASTSFETAICSDPEISRADEVLAQAYATALGGLSKAAASEVISAQKSWLAYAERVCSADAEPIATDYDEDQLKCLGSAFRSRIGDLEASRMQGGYRFYPVDRYLVQKDTEAEPDAFNKLADKAFHTVKIDRSDDTAAAFNAMVDGLMADQGTFFETGTSKIATDDVTSDYDIATKVKDVTSRRITLETNQWWYGHGAAHGNYFISYGHFLVDEKRPLVPSDIFEGSWEERLSEIALPAIKAKLGEDYFDGSDDNVASIAIDPRRWDLTPEGLVIQFNIYEVTAYAAGAPTLTIPWAQLEGVLTDQADSIAGFY